MTSFVRNFVDVCIHVAVIAIRWPRVVRQLVTCVILRHKLELSLESKRKSHQKSPDSNSLNSKVYLKTSPTGM